MTYHDSKAALIASRPTRIVPDLPIVSSLESEEIWVAFQPIVDVADGKPFAYEALARCYRPGLESPQVLFSQADREGACGPLGRLIRNKAFSCCEDAPLFVNIHPEELRAPWLVQPDDPIGFHSPGVYLEITETTAFKHFDLCMNVLAELCQRSSVKLVIDDFGAGYSNLERVLELEPTVLKLDLALTRAIDSHRRKQTVVRHVVNLCNELGSRVVAEGVETVDELRCLCDLGVDYVQGYLLGRPARALEPPTWPLPGHPRRRHSSTKRRAATVARLRPPGSHAAASDASSPFAGVVEEISAPAKPTYTRIRRSP